MCSISGVFDIKTDVIELREETLELSRLMRHRGLDWSDIYANDNAILTHERLPVVDVNAGAQPLYNQQKTHVLTVDGEIYNHQVLRAEYGGRYQFQTGSDCEVILTLYQEKGPEFLDNLQGMLTFALYDDEKDTCLIGRDRLGIIPLCVGYNEHGQLYVVSEVKALVPVCRTTREFPARSYLWSQDDEIRSYYYRDRFGYDAVKDNVIDKNELRRTPEDSVKSHLVSGVPYGVLLSGGLDSSIISTITKKYAARRAEGQERSETQWSQLHSSATGLPGSLDPKTTQGVANYLGTVRHEVYFIVQEGLDAICDVIHHIETYDTTAIRASTPMYLMSHKIRVMGIKVVLSDEGSDEMPGGYLYFHKAPNIKGLHEEMVRRLLALYMYNYAHTNKAMSVWGAKVRIPLLDKEFLDVAMRINPQDKMCGSGRVEKHILRKRFETYLPVDVVWRQKEWFSDGVGYNWIDTLKGVAAQQVSDRQLETVRFRFSYNTPISEGVYLYREIFKELFPLPNAAECVSGGPSVACSPAKTIKWDEAFKKMGDPPGHVVGVH